MPRLEAEAIELAIAIWQHLPLMGLVDCCWKKLLVQNPGRLWNLLGGTYFYHFNTSSRKQRTKNHNKSQGRTLGADAEERRFKARKGQLF